MKKFLSLLPVSLFLMGVMAHRAFAEEVLETYPEYAGFCVSVTSLAYDEYLTALMDLQQGVVDGMLIAA